MPKLANALILIIILTKESPDEVRCMVCKAGHVNAPETGQKVALLLVEVCVPWDLGVLGTLERVFMLMMTMMMMMIRRRGMNKNHAD